MSNKINITSKSEDVQLGDSIWNLTKTWEVLLFVTWLKMGDCEESKDDRTGANHCDNNLKSSRHDIFPIMLPKMSTLWRTVRKWFAENLKGRFERCSSCQMQYSPQLGEKGSPCSGDGSLLAGPSRHPRCSKNGYGWPVACLKFAGAWSRGAARRLCCVWVLCGGSSGMDSPSSCHMLAAGHGLWGPRGTIAEGRAVCSWSLFSKARHASSRGSGAVKAGRGWWWHIRCLHCSLRACFWWNTGPSHAVRVWVVWQGCGLPARSDMCWPCLDQHQQRDAQSLLRFSHYCALLPVQSIQYVF